MAAMCGIKSRPSKSPLISTFHAIYVVPATGKSECSQPQNLKWENVDDTPLGK